jgi:hypothetical protein
MVASMLLVNLGPVAGNQHFAFTFLPAGQQSGVKPYAFTIATLTG